MDAPDPLYYWTNLRTVIDTVLETQQHVFGVDQHAQLLRWLALPRSAQLLYARLLQRRGPAFRVASLRYAEIDDLDAAITALHAGEFVDASPTLPLSERVALFTVRELERAAPVRPVGKLRRPELVQWLIEQDAAGLNAGLRALDRIIVRKVASLFSRALVLFFGNRQQDLSAFVRAAIDQVRYADYPVDRSHPLFATRAQFDAYLEAGARWDAAFEARMAKDDARLVELGEAAALDLVMRAPTAPHRERVDPARADARVIYRAARAREQRAEVADAMRLYGLLIDERRHLPTAARAADRLGLLMHRAKDVAGYRERVEPLLNSDGLSDPSQRLIRRRLRLMRLGTDPRQNDPPVAVRAFRFMGAGHAGSKALYRLPTGEVGSVEEAVLAQLGGDGVWCEGGLYATLFALLCWDIIFAPLPGAFQHRFQDAPVDFETALFYLRRKTRFQRRFAELAEADLAEPIAAAWQAYQGIACRGALWTFEPSLLVRAGRDLGAGLLHILRRYARHPGRHRAGLPDLLVWPQGEEGPLLVEVKGPGDQVSIEQALWHAWMRRHGVPICVARVTREASG